MLRLKTSWLSSRRSSPKMTLTPEIRTTAALATKRPRAIWSGDRQALDDVKRFRAAQPEQTFMIKHAISDRCKEKRLEKELPWQLKPPDEREMYRQAERKQWEKHVQFGAFNHFVTSTGPLPRVACVCGRHWGSIPQWHSCS